MSMIREILRVLHTGGMSYRQIGALLGVSHNTIARYDKLRFEKNITPEKLSEMDDTTLEFCFNTRVLTGQENKPLPDFEQFHRELKIRGVTLEILWQEYRQKHAVGYSYTHIARLFNQWARKLNISMRQIHRAGEKLFVDFSGKRLPITNRDTGEVFMAEIFVAAMGASNKTYVEACQSQQIPHWLLANANALSYFGGVPAMIVPDNLKSAVLKNNRGNIQLNPQFVDFARHYGTVIIPARPKKPRDKPKVEGAVRIVQMWILAKLRNHIFYSIAEANAEIWRLLKEFNTRPFKKIKGSREELFRLIDQPALRALPPEPYEYADWKLNVRVGPDYVVEYQESFYMVPYTLIDRYVDLRATAMTIEVFFKNRRVASHGRSHKPGAVATEKAFMPVAHQHHSEWSATRLMAWGQSVGESMEKVIHHLLKEKTHPESGFRACIALVEEGKLHGLDRVESAASVAIQINSITLTSIRSILRTGRDKLRLVVSNDELRQPPDSTPQFHENIRGSEYYK